MYLFLLVWVGFLLCVKYILSQLPVHNNKNHRPLRWVLCSVSRPAAECRECGCVGLLVPGLKAAPAVKHWQWTAPGWPARTGRERERPFLWSGTRRSGRICRTRADRLASAAEESDLHGQSFHHSMHVVMFDFALDVLNYFNANFVLKNKTIKATVVTTDYKGFLHCNITPQTTNH